jgi:hypothetical protein
MEIVNAKITKSCLIFDEHISKLKLDIILELAREGASGAALCLYSQHFDDLFRITEAKSFDDIKNNIIQVSIENNTIRDLYHPIDKTIILNRFC